jgi:hypothetical protein
MVRVKPGGCWEKKKNGFTGQTSSYAAAVWWGGEGNGRLTVGPPPGKRLRVEG